jgi:putative peptide zinc metalloprotease protein
MENSIENKDYLFKLPIRLNANLKLQEFQTQTQELDFLVFVDDRQYHLNSSMFKLIKTIEKYDNLEDITKEYSTIQNEEYQINDVAIVINDFLAKKGIVETINPIELAKRGSFLYFKRTIFPQNFLEPISNVFQHLFQPTIAKILVLLIISAYYYFFVSFYNKINLSDLLNSPGTLMLTFVILTVSSLFHEIGHISACHYYGVKHGEVGIGIYLRFPVMYANLSNTWSLPGTKRAVIDIAGIYFQLVLNVLFFILFLLTNQKVYIYAVQVIGIQSLLSLNPFLRFDGYWLATDLLGIPNLRQRSAEIIEYFISKYIIQKKNLKAPITLSIKPKFLYSFFFYALISNLFLVYFLIIMFFYLPNMLRVFPSEILTLYKGFMHEFSIQQYFKGISDVFKILIKSLFLGISIYFFFRMLIYLYNTIKKYILIAINEKK